MRQKHTVFDGRAANRVDRRSDKRCGLGLRADPGREEDERKDEEETTRFGATRKEKIVFYQVDARLVDLESNAVVWSGQHKIKKYIERKPFGL